MSIQLTEHTQRAILIAHEQAQRENSAAVRPMHLLLGLLYFDDNKGHEIVRTRTQEIERIRQAAKELLKAEHQANTSDQEVTWDTQAKRVLECMIEEATILRTEAVGTEHLLLGLLRVESSQAVLNEFGIGLDPIRKLLAEKHTVTDPIEVFPEDADPGQTCALEVLRLALNGNCRGIVLERSAGIVAISFTSNIDGLLPTAPKMELDTYAAVREYLKRLANLKSVSSDSQQGGFYIKNRGKPILIKLAIKPWADGERINIEIEQDRANSA